MASFEQLGQIVTTQINADRVTINQQIHRQATPHSLDQGPSDRYGAAVRDTVRWITDKEATASPFFCHNIRARGSR
jgi:paraquat-inducible protein B